jgi:hypothetical protein
MPKRNGQRPVEQTQSVTTESIASSPFTWKK